MVQDWVDQKVGPGLTAKVLDICFGVGVQINFSRL